MNLDNRILSTNIAEVTASIVCTTQTAVGAEVNQVFLRKAMRKGSKIDRSHDHRKDIFMLQFCILFPEHLIYASLRVDPPPSLSHCLLNKKPHKTSHFVGETRNKVRNLRCYKYHKMVNLIAKNIQYLSYKTIFYHIHIIACTQLVFHV